MRDIYPKLSQILRLIFFVMLVGILTGLTIVTAQEPPAEVITVGENKVAVVSASQSQNFVFSAAAGQTITIQALAITPGLAPAVAVLTQDAVLIESFDNPFLNSNISGVVTFTEAGDYLIPVSTRNGVEGEVLISITEGGTPPPPPTPLTYDQPTEDILDPGATIVYSFDGPSDPNIGLRLIYRSLDPMRGLSVELGITDGRLLATFSNDIREAEVMIPEGAPVSYLLSLTNDHPAAVTIQYSLLLQTVNLAEPTPTPVPATLVPLPDTGACVLATQGQFVNVRQGPSTSAPIITTIFPTVIYNVLGRNAEGTWYQIAIPEGSGWVSAAVTRRGGDCSAVPVVSPATATATTTGATATATTTEATATQEATLEASATPSATLTWTPEATASPTP